MTRDLLSDPLVRQVWEDVERQVRSMTDSQVAAAAAALSSPAALSFLRTVERQRKAARQLGNPFQAPTPPPELSDAVDAVKREKRVAQRARAERRRIRERMILQRAARSKERGQSL
jgi:hypothetical protein